MLELLTGTGLATAAGLNAYIPLMVIGLLDRYTNLINLPSAWSWLGNGWVLMILAVLLAIEFVADKVPVVDSVNDVVQTVVRPTAGGMAFAAGSGSETVTVTDPSALWTQKLWIPIAIGLLIALTVHGTKAAARPVMNAASFGVAAPVVSTVEDGASIGLAVVAIVMPFLVIIFVFVFFWWMLTVSRRRRRRREQRALSENAQRPTGVAKRL
ncbi:membrane protein [Catellatospora methionotrophica]|uniref:Membrane protein n=1 Tax=Catellatospora methionotrophica TaxID=121620 RepID=A0A8J3PGH9_9ACTN|nr:DUF4126 domain-containing protein [Catellatospora methionotrophica]GIG15709.1 membrane protein [Catellatospora methionotrophica]